jgi:hypothetical protein
MKLKISIKTVYGKDLIYPADETAEMLVSLTGKKTFDKRDLVTIQNLGYEIEQVSAYELKLKETKV